MILKTEHCDIPDLPGGDWSLTSNRKQIIGSLSNDDADGNENGKKAIGLISKTATLHVHHDFFVHFFAVVARLQRENA